MKKKLKNINYKKYLDILLKAIFAGIMIAIGAIVYLSLANKIAGSILFSIGLLTICMYGMNLYTGKIGYILINKTKFILELLITLIGNFIGTFLVALAIQNTRLSNIIEKAETLSKIKLDDTLLSIFILSIFCGILMYIAVNNYKKSTNLFSKYIGIFMCVTVFLLCNFEHCVANMFYFSLSNAWSIETLKYMLVMILGNSAGSILIALFYNKYYKN